MGHRFPVMGTPLAARRDRQVVRLLTLLRILKEGGRPSIYELAARFHTRRETVYRDLRALQAIGYPIVGDADGRLSHPSLAPEIRATIPPVLLTQKELAALVWATKQAGSKQPFRAGLDSALLKLQALAPGKEGRLGLVLSGIIGGWARGIKDYTDSQPIILQVVEAIVARRRCLVEYQAPYRERPNKFRYDPYRLLTIQGLLYCIGQVPAHGTLVTLAIDRIRSLKVTEELFAVDPKFDLKKYEAEAFGVVWEKPMTVVVRFHPDQAPYIREREWHPTQKLRTLRDGRLELTFRAGGTFEITRWILGWGDAAEVVRPAGLRRDVAAILKSATSLYRAQRKSPENL